MPQTSNILYLDQLFRREAEEMYQDEKLLAEAFELFRKAASNPLLGELFERARRQTQEIASAIKAELSGGTLVSKRSALRGILEDGQKRVASLGDHHLVDAELIATMQRLLGYQLAGYHNVANFARMLREDALQAVLTRAIEQKRASVDHLSEVALHQVHWRANWWAPEHASAWERVKAAFRKDWEQTVARFRKEEGVGPEQTAGDTLAQMSGQEPVFEAGEPAFRYGYGAAHHYRDRDWDEDLETELRTNYGGLWEPARDNIRAGWDYARPQPPAAAEPRTPTVKARALRLET